MDPRTTVENYLQALEAHEYETARTYLSDGEFSYRSPIAEFDNADAFISYVAFSAGIVQRITIRKAFVDGDDVCHFLTTRIQISSKVSVDLVHWAQVCDGRIARVEVIFDAHPYRLMFSEPGEVSAWL